MRAGRSFPRFQNNNLKTSPKIFAWDLGIINMEHYAWHQHVNLAYYEGVKDGASGSEKKPATGWLTDYISYYEKGYKEGSTQDDS